MKLSAASDLFDSVSSRYGDAYDSDGPEGHLLRARLSAVIRLMAGDGGLALDAGMGPGRLCEELDQRGWSTVGIDPSTEMVRLVRARLPHIAGHFFGASIETLPFAGSTFDAVVVTGVLEYVADPGTALAETARVLRPGGLAVIGVPNLAAPAVLWRHRLFYPAVRAVKRFVPSSRPAPLPRQLISTTRLESMLRDAGLVPTALETVGCVVVPAPFDQLVPALTTRLARRLERRGPPAGAMRRLGAQVVVSARRG